MFDVTCVECWIDDESERAFAVTSVWNAGLVMKMGAFAMTSMWNVGSMMKVGQPLL